ncbi:MAG: MBL fold metallo-hydrolase, partial [Muribaculaceae bacterium]|nr:MBL fold metallo-hydrolase [Muribaculaceae bacterium]
MKVKRFEFNMFGENTYIVFDERTRHAAIIDPGMLNQRENTTFSDYIDDNKLIIRYLIATHIHIDHVLGIEYVENRYGVGLSASADDAFLAKRVAQQAEMFHLPINVPEEIKLAQNLTEGDVLPLGDDALKVINVPGHSPGS